VTTARALFGAPAAIDALAESRTGKVELAFGRGAYVSLGPHLVMLAGAAVPFGPLSLVVEELEEGLDTLVAGSVVRVVAGQRLTVENVAISLQRARTRAMLELDDGLVAPAAAIGDAAAAVRAALPELAPPIMSGIAALAAGRLREGVRALAGLGEGLTPAGDDVLAGYSAALVALGRSGDGDGVAASALAGPRASPLGLAYLRCAERGELPDLAARLLLAIRRGFAEAVQTALVDLEAWGASSGLGLAWGMTAAVAHCLSTAPIDGKEEPCHVQVSDSGFTFSRMRRSSTSLPLMECSRSPAATTRSSTPS
jgi:hypothetical protein